MKRRDPVSVFVAPKKSKFEQNKKLVEKIDNALNGKTKNKYEKDKGFKPFLFSVSKEEMHRIIFKVVNVYIAKKVYQRQLLKK